ncbi:MAG: hypothetical protein COV07_04145 [Candidatus Vogelbacteria bacterium CG10_big_fil_rev_8_21_14_0_10_45_14]|uniref:PKD domain-containing protein n=1 Tax=Candidatus Vogelbacteria bacterium CG10_big_fil_rev_8_21_14_0_10_45_14 TaxID=1975042 RepID=A0A2H0RIZ0_9BACT|nr:MAG: hypothetical protein COV07_04145 [Candidatus Vogelbacteria bacterium CG10_big_fil_rev_8_21_14_0_10_45_14]
MSQAHKLAGLMVIAFFLAYLGNSATPARSLVAQTGGFGDDVGNLSGFAWGSDTVLDSGTKGGMGWLSFSCTNLGTCNATPYGVNLESNGSLSGYAWSSNLGWLSMCDGVVTGSCGSPPASGTAGVSVLLSEANITAPHTSQTGKPVVGFGRFCSVFESGCSGALRSDSARGGWDGWVSFSGQNHGVVLKQNDGTDGSGEPRDTFHGYAWGGGDVIGYLSMSGNGYGVIKGTQPLQILSCAPSQSNALVNVTDILWSFYVSGGGGSYNIFWEEWRDSTPVSGTIPDQKTYTQTGNYTRKLTVSSGGESHSLDCGGGVLVQEGLPYFTINAHPTSVELPGGLGDTDPVVVLTVVPWKGSAEEYYKEDVTITATLWQGSKEIKDGVTWDITPNPVKNIDDPQSTYDEKVLLVMTKSGTPLDAGKLYTIKVRAIGADTVESKVDVTIGVEGTSSGFEEI